MTAPNPKNVTLDLTEQWPVVLKALETAADEMRRQGRDVAEAMILETRYSLNRQLQHFQEAVNA